MKKWNDSPKIQELLSRMTLQEKIGQLNQRNICAYDEHVEEIKQEVREGKIGSLLFSGKCLSPLLLFRSSNQKRAGSSLAS